jgi:hypothetical protein
MSDMEFVLDASSNNDLKQNNNIINNMISPNNEKKPIYNKNQKILIELVNMVKRMTTWTDEEAFKQLQKHNFDYTSTIREYMGGESKKEEDNKSTNQKIYSEIRGMMDDASTNHRRFQEQQEIKQKIMMQNNSNNNN